MGPAAAEPLGLCAQPLFLEPRTRTEEHYGRRCRPNCRENSTAGREWKAKGHRKLAIFARPARPITERPPKTRTPFGAACGWCLIKALFRNQTENGLRSGDLGIQGCAAPTVGRSRGTLITAQTGKVNQPAWAGAGKIRSCAAKSRKIYRNHSTPGLKTGFPGVKKKFFLRRPHRHDASAIPLFYLFDAKGAYKARGSEGPEGRRSCRMAIRAHCHFGRIHDHWQHLGKCR